MKLDLHIHSYRSHDGMERIDKIINTAIKRGLDGIAICDHDVFGAYDEAKRVAQAQERTPVPDGFVVIPGVEYSTDAGHVLALFVTRGYELRRDARGLCRLVDLRMAASADGALLVAAHPFRKRETLPDILMPNVDGVEVANARDTVKTPGNTAKSRAVAAEHGKFITGGSDGHILQEIGMCYTILPDNTERTPEGVRAALLSGSTDGGGDGGRLRYQAQSKLRKTKPKKFFKDLARFIVFTAKDVTG